MAPPARCSNSAKGSVFPFVADVFVPAPNQVLSGPNISLVIEINHNDVGETSKHRLFRKNSRMIHDCVFIVHPRRIQFIRQLKCITKVIHQLGTVRIIFGTFPVRKVGIVHVARPVVTVLSDKISAAVDPYRFIVFALVGQQQDTLPFRDVVRKGQARIVVFDDNVSPWLGSSFVC